VTVPKVLELAVKRRKKKKPNPSEKPCS